MLVDQVRRLATDKGFALTHRGAEIRLVDLHSGLPALNDDAGLVFTLIQAMEYLERAPNRPISDRHPARRSH